ncbi:MAG TPA: hypothetical protein VHE34_08600 [Puia sp.]|uniref:hypothetical protein n=1 Tax=Puia sp. TaxID=2045100 RepID=UPI002CC86217|nr:hypothetical protein [Puia sp.]HVU95269.1 hypothetical protein [Puia sp.]
MTKLTRYTSFQELKASEDILPPQTSNSRRELEMKELLSMLKDNSSPLRNADPNENLNESNRGK